MSERSVEEILEIFDKHSIGLEDVCRVIIHWYDLSIFDGTPIGKLRDAAQDRDNNASCIVSFFSKRSPRMTKVKQHKSRILAPQCSIHHQLAHRTSKDNFKLAAVNN